MKYLLLLLILTLSTLFSASLTLDKQIAQLKDADPKERFTLMNALKLRIATMNASERSSAITQLKTQMHQKNISYQNDSRQNTKRCSPQTRCSRYINKSALKILTQVVKIQTGLMVVVGTKNQIEGRFGICVFFLDFFFSYM